MQQAKLLLFTGPSAVGKATIERELFNDDSLRLAFSISATTRAPRPGEFEGVNYYFKTDEAFEKLIRDDAFLEWSAHFSHKYGTLKSEVARIQKEHLIPFLEVDVNGAESILKQVKKLNVVSIFVAPPSIENLRERIKMRGSETEAQINERLARVAEELSKIHLFDHIVVNDDVAEAVSRIKNIIRSEYAIHN